MEIIWILAALAVFGFSLAAYFAKSWLNLKGELAALNANQLANQDLETKSKLMKAEFEALSQKLLTERAKEMRVQHSDSLSHILKPLTTELDAFKKRINEVYENETRDRVSLRQEIMSLKALNHKMSEDAIKLTRALKGDNKIAGNWGELVLDQILTASGLREGYEYIRQVSTATDNGGRLQPDVVISIPGQKCLIIDAKLSLKDYERAVSSVDEKEREIALKAHANSLKTHIRGLSEKNYNGLPGITTVDFAIMFVPIEPAFSAALETSSQLFTEALAKGVVIASPTTLLALLRTVEHVSVSYTHLTLPTIE